MTPRLPSKQQWQHALVYCTISLKMFKLNCQWLTDTLLEILFVFVYEWKKATKKNAKMDSLFELKCTQPKNIWNFAFLKVHFLLHCSLFSIFMWPLGHSAISKIILKSKSSHPTVQFKWSARSFLVCPLDRKWATADRNSWLDHQIRPRTYISISGFIT